MDKDKCEFPSYPCLTVFNPWPCFRYDPFFLPSSFLESDGCAGSGPVLRPFNSGCVFNKGPGALWVGSVYFKLDEFVVAAPGGLTVLPNVAGLVPVMGRR